MDATEFELTDPVEATAFAAMIAGDLESLVEIFSAQMRVQSSLRALVAVLS